MAIEESQPRVTQASFGVVVDVSTQFFGKVLQGTNTNSCQATLPRRNWASKISNFFEWRLARFQVDFRDVISGRRLGKRRFYFRFSSLARFAYISAFVRCPSLFGLGSGRKVEGKFLFEYVRNLTYSKPETLKLIRFVWNMNLERGESASERLANKLSEGLSSDLNALAACENLIRKI